MWRTLDVATRLHLSSGYSMITAMHRQLDTSDEERLQTQLLSAQCRRRQFETVLSEIELKFRLAAPSHRPRPTTHRRTATSYTLSRLCNSRQLKPPPCRSSSAPDSCVARGWLASASSGQNNLRKTSPSLLLSNTGFERGERFLASFSVVSHAKVSCHCCPP